MMSASYLAGMSNLAGYEDVVYLLWSYLNLDGLNMLLLIFTALYSLTAVVVIIFEV